MRFKVQLPNNTAKDITADGWREVGHEGRWIEFYSKATGGPVQVYRQEKVLEIRVVQEEEPA